MGSRDRRPDHARKIISPVRPQPGPLIQAPVVGLLSIFSTHVLLGDVPGRLAPFRNRGELPLFSGEPDRSLSLSLNCRQLRRWNGRLIRFPAKNESASVPRNCTGCGAIDQVQRSRIGCTPKKRFVRLKSKQSPKHRKTLSRPAIRRRTRRLRGASGHARPRSENRSTGGRCRLWKRRRI